MADNHIKIGAAWKSIDNCSVKIGAAWKQVQTIYVKIGSTWKVAWNNLVIQINDIGYSPVSLSSPTFGRLIVNQDGNVYHRRNADSDVQENASTDWARPTSAAPGAYQIRYTAVTGDTGDFTATAAINVWHDLSAGDYTFTMQDDNTAAGGNEVVITVEIGTGDVAIDSATWTLGADRQV